MASQLEFKVYAGFVLGLMFMTSGSKVAEEQQGGFS
jgi:hypothetical protein